MQRIRGQRGVAMVTVLLIAAAMTVVASTAAFVTIRELGQGTDDQKAARALAFAEAGIDRMINRVRGSGWASTVMSGCGTITVIRGGVPRTREFPTVRIQGTFPEVPNATFDVVLERPDDCVGVTSIPDPRDPQTMEIVSTGEHPTAKRVLQQDVEVVAGRLPIGLAGGTGQAGGTPDIIGMSIITRGDIIGREHLDLTGEDLFYTKGDFYPCEDGQTPGDGCVPTGQEDDPMPAGAHAGGVIYEKQNATDEIHPPSPNCLYPFDGSSLGEDFTGNPCSGDEPPTSYFDANDAERMSPAMAEEDLFFFKALAQESGIYCLDSACTLNGAAYDDVSDRVTNDDYEAAEQKVIYIEFPSGNPDDNTNTVNWQVDFEECEDQDPEGSNMAIVIIRNGSTQMASNSGVTGAMFVEDGSFFTAGTYQVEGTIVAETLQIQGTANYLMTECWLDNIPGSFLSVTPLQWRELDR